MNYKFAVVLNKKIQPGVAINAASHIMASLGNLADENDRTHMSFKKYRDGDGEEHTVSGLPLIVLKASNSNKLNTLREKAMAGGMLVTPFFESMTGGTWEEQLERTGKVSTEELNYYGVGLFGEREQIEALTRKFSLWT